MTQLEKGTTDLHVTSKLVGQSGFRFHETVAVPVVSKLDIRTLPKTERQAW